MEKKTNVNFVAKENLDFISEVFKKEESVSSHSILDELERLHIEVRAGNGNIMPGMLVFGNKTPSLPLYPANKEGCCVLCKAEIQILKEQIEQFLQRKDECKPLHLLNKNKKAMKKKYELTDQTINVDGRTLHRIKALRDFSDVQAGELGGWIEKEENLSHAGKAWVYCEACVFDNAKVSDCAKISGYAKVFCNACVYGSAEVRCYAKVYDDAEVYDRAWVSGRTKIFGRSQVYGRAKVSESAQIDEDVKILNWAEVYGNAQVFGHTLVCGRAKVYGYVRLCCDCFIGGDAEVCDKSDYIVFKNFWSSGRYFVWTRSNNRWRVGCFYGTGEELIKHAYADSEKSGREYERAVRYVESILADEEKEKE